MVVQQAQRTGRNSGLSADINIISAYIILKDYGVNIEEVKQLIAPKLFKDGKIPA